MPCLQQRKTPRVFTACTRSQASTDVSRTEASSSGEMPALLYRTSIPPNRAAVASIIARTFVSSATFARNANASPEQRPAVSSAASRLTSAAHTRAPSSVNTIAASRPMPPPAPVITQAFPSSRPAISALRREEHGLDLRVAVERLHAELTAEAGLLEAPERRRHAHRRVRVDAEDARVDCAGHAQRPRAVTRPDRAREPVRRVVGEPHRLGLVLERDQRGDRAEDLLTGDAVVVRGLDDRRRVPEPPTVRRLAAEERLALDEARHGLPVGGRDQRAHLGRLVLRIADAESARRVDQ